MSLIPRIGGDYDGIPYEVVEGKKPPARLVYDVIGEKTVFGSTPHPHRESHHYALKTTVRWDEQINFRYEQEYVYAGHWPPKETDDA